MDGLGENGSLRMKIGEWRGVVGVARFGVNCVDVGAGVELKS